MGFSTLGRGHAASQLLSLPRPRQVWEPGRADGSLLPRHGGAEGKGGAVAIVGMTWVHLAHCWPAKLVPVHAALLEVTGKGITYADNPGETAPPIENTQAAWPRTKGGPHLVTLSDAMCDGLQLRHDLLILEVIREGFRPLLQ